MPRGEWDDNTWYDDGDFPPVSKNEGRGGMVAAAIFSFLMCAFNAVGSACFLFWAGVCALVAADNQNGMNMFPADMVQVYVFGFLGIGSLSGIAFFLQLFGGIGLIRGRRWARTITLWLAGCSLLVAIGLVAAVVYSLLNSGGNEEAEHTAVLMIGAALLHATYAIVELSLLLQPAVARRYR